MVDYTQGFSVFAVTDTDAAKTFYGEVLGLEVGEEHGMLNISLPGGARVMVYPKDDHEPAVFTILNLAVDDLPAVVDELAGRGVTWLRYEGTLLLVTHDRRMLETVRIDRRWHVEAGTVDEA